MNQRLTKARMAERVESETSGIASDLAKMIIAKKAPTDLVDDITGHKKRRLEALNLFQSLADSPTSIKHGTEMAELATSISVASKATADAVALERIDDAMKKFKVYTSITADMRGKTDEASQFQQDELVVEEKNKETSSNIWMVLIAGSLFATAGAIFGGIILTRGIATPLAAAVTHLGEISQGDLSKDAPADFQARGDEIGTLARAKQTMIVNLRKMIQEIASGIQVLSSSSTELLSSSEQMTSGSRSASDKAHSVSAAAEEMSSNITSVAAGMEQTTTNLGHVSSATE